mgnify:CR=1 FL=1
MHGTQVPPLHVPPAQGVPSATGVWEQVFVWVLQVSVVQGLPSSHWLSLMQQPAMGVRVHVPLVQAAVLQVAEGQSLAEQHCRQVPPQQCGVLPEHMETHVPLPLQVSQFAALQVPQLPPQLLSPQVLPAQFGVQPQTSGMPPPPQVFGARHVLLHVPQFWLVVRSEQTLRQQP